MISETRAVVREGYMSASDILIAMSLAYGGHLVSITSKSVVKVLSQVASSHPQLIKKFKRPSTTYMYYHQSLVPVVAREYFVVRKDSPQSARRIPPERIALTLQKLDQKFGGLQ